MASMTTKEKIRRAAVQLFAEQGYHGTKTSEIAKLAGVAEGTIFKYYPKKKELLKQVAIETVEIFADHEVVYGLEQVLEHSDGMSAEEYLIAMVRNRLELMKENKDTLKILFVEMQFHDEVKQCFRESFLKNMLSVGERIVMKLREKIEVGEYSDMDLLRGLIGMVAGILFQMRLLDATAQKPEDVIRNSVRIYLQGIRRDTNERE